MNDKPSTRADLATLLAPGSILIELGVARGQFAIQLITRNPAIKYVGIDRWSDHHDGEEYGNAKALIEMVGGTVIRSTFADAVPLIEDESVDMIYIDGYAHTGQEGGQTLRDWYPKLKPGGIFAGHDYSPINYPQTVRAVEEFVRSINREADLNIINEASEPSWWLRK